MRTFFLTLLTAALSFAADATGKWTGTIELKGPDGEARSRPAYMVLKQEGATLTGSGGPDADRQHPMRDGKVDGNKLTFSVDDGGRAIEFSLIVDGDTLKGDAKSEHDGQKMTAKLDLKREK